MLRSSLLALVLCTAALPAQDEGFFIQIDRYDVEATLVPEADRVEVEADLTITNRTFYPLEVMDLFFNGQAEIQTATVNGEPVSFENIGSRGAAERRLVFSFAEPITVEETFSVQVTFGIVYIERGLGVAIEPGSTHLLYESKWLPWLHEMDSDHGADNAPGRVVVHAPPGETVIVPGRLTERVEAEETATWTFDLELPARPVIVAGDYHLVETEHEGQEAIGYLYRDMGPRNEEAMRALLTSAGEIYAFYEGLFGPLPEAPLRIVAMDRPGGYGLPRCLLLNRETFEFEGGEMDEETFAFLAHEIAHSWFPGLVRPRGMTVGMMSEALASWMAGLATEEFLGDAAGRQQWQAYQSRYASLERRVPLSNIAPGSQAYPASVYNKGAYWWRTLERILGRDRLTELLRTFAQEHRLQTVSFEEIIDDIDEHTETDLSELERWFLRTVDLANVAIRTEPRIEERAGQVEVELSLETTGFKDLPLDIEVKLSDGSTVRETRPLGDSAHQTVTMLLPAEPVQVVLDPDHWLIQSHYRDDQWPRALDAMGHYQRAAARWRQGEYQAGLEPIAEALARQPENAQFHLMAGLLLEGAEDSRSAFEHLERARDLAPEESDSITRAWAQVALGRVCKQLGLIDDARGHWFQVMNTEETRTPFAEAQAALRQLDREQATE